MRVLLFDGRVRVIFHIFETAIPMSPLGLTIGVRVISRGRVPAIFPDFFATVHIHDDEIQSDSMPSLLSDIFDNTSWVSSSECTGAFNETSRADIRVDMRRTSFSGTFK